MFSIVTEARDQTYQGLSSLERPWERGWGASRIVFRNLYWPLSKIRLVTCLFRPPSVSCFYMVRLGSLRSPGSGSHAMEC